MSRLVRCVALAAFWLSPVAAMAAGLFLAPPTLEGMGQGGAVVASTQDPMALTYNPAGLAQGRSQAVLDVGLPLFASRYVRTVGATGAPMPAVRGHTLSLAVPNVGLLWAPKAQKAPRLAALVTADYPLLQRWPDGRVYPESPQRYATGGFGGSALARAMVGGAWAPVPFLRFGAAVQWLVGQVQTQSTLSACDGVICRQPEDARYDAIANIKSAWVRAPGFALGVQADLRPHLRFGASYTSGFRISSPIAVAVTLPRAPLYSGTALTPDRPTGRLVMRLPGTFRLGAEVLLPRGLRLEAALSYTLWQVHQALALTELNASITHVPALEQFRLRDVAVPRQLKNTLAAHVAWRRPFVVHGHDFALFGGVMLEPSAADDTMLTAMAVDLPKGLVAMGASWQTAVVRLSAGAAYVGMLSRTVRTSAVKQQNPTVAPSAAQLTAVGNGHYSGGALIAGVSTHFYF